MQQYFCAEIGEYVYLATEVDAALAELNGIIEQMRVVRLFRLEPEPLGDEFQKVLNTVPYESESEAIKAFYDPKNDNMSCKEFKEKYPEKGDQGEDDNAKT